MRIRELEVSEFFEEDLQHIVPRRYDEDFVRKIIEGSLGNYCAFENMGPAYTARHSGKIIFCGGIRLMWEGVGEVWSIGDKVLARRYAKEVYLWQDELLKQEVKNRRFHRLQAHVVKKWKSACNFMERLGFAPEAVLYKYGPDGSDYVLYARIF